MLSAFAVILLTLKVAVASRLWKHPSSNTSLSAACDGNGQAKGAPSKPCGKYDVPVDFGTGVQHQSVQLYCYEPQMDGGKAKLGTTGVCLIPRLKYCSKDEECRFGSVCRVSHQSGYKTCQTGGEAGTICDGDGSGKGDCAEYHWAPTGEAIPQKWTYARLYCMDMSSLDTSHYKYTPKGYSGLCKVWENQVCATDDDCMFGLFCVNRICRYDSTQTHTPRQRKLVVHAARVIQTSRSRKLYYDKLYIEDNSGVPHTVTSPFALASKIQSLSMPKLEKLRDVEAKLDALYTSIQDSFASIRPVQVGSAGRSGSRLYASGDSKWILKQVRKNEFETLADAATDNEILKSFESGAWSLSSSMGVLSGSLLNLPVLTITPGLWIVVRNMSDYHSKLLQSGRNSTFEVLQQFDIKPPPARSDDRAQFLTTLLTFNNGEGLRLAKMLNFYRAVANYDLEMLNRLHLVDYSILIEMYDLGSADIVQSELGHTCIAHESCSFLGHAQCVVFCFSIIDWLRPFLPGSQYNVDIENSFKGRKFTDYAGKTKLLLECISSFGVSNALHPTDVYSSEVYVPVLSRARYSDACSSRWKDEQGVEINLLATACKPFVQARVSFTSFGVSDDCALSLTATSRDGVCQNHNDCREGESCKFMVLGQSIGCYQIPLLGRPSLHTLTTQCAAYSIDLCQDRQLDARDHLKLREDWDGEEPRMP